ncbi:MAG: YbgA family protein [Candidatus Krumholzibacteriia bacterium]
MTTSEIRIGVSSCLLGQEVRYDGGHKHYRYATDVLAEYFTLVPVCPEVEVGMAIPRETVRLQGDPAAPRMVAPRSGEDWTDRMNAWSRKRTRELAAEDLCGYLFKKNSPSCGVFRLKVYQDKGMPDHGGRGLFAAAFIAANPLLPVEEEGRLSDPHLRENFIERVFAYHRLKALFAGRWKRGDVVAFHSREKYLLMAHSPRHYKELGQLVAAVADHGPAAFRDRYMELFMQGLEVKATTRRHVNALLHVAGHLRGTVPDPEQKRVIAVIGEYGKGLVPLVVPMTLLKHYIELHDLPYVGAQSYLAPHPKELMLRNHV